MILLYKLESLRHHKAVVCAVLFNNVNILLDQSSSYHNPQGFVLKRRKDSVESHFIYSSPHFMIWLLKKLKLSKIWPGFWFRVLCVCLLSRDWLRSILATKIPVAYNGHL